MSLANSVDRSQQFLDLLSRMAQNSTNPRQTLESIAYLAGIASTARLEPGIAKSIVEELRSQRSSIKLIASENYSSLAVQLAMGNLLTDKYAEGVPAARYYAGCENVDQIEARTRALACELFEVEHAYVQPHSGADANLIAYWSILTRFVEEPALREAGVKRASDAAPEVWEAVRNRLCNQRILALGFKSGGHLTHGSRANLSSKMFDAHAYEVDPKTELLNYDLIAAQARQVRPLILLAGYSAYSRRIDFARMRQIADDVGAILMVDMAHFAGLVAGKVFQGNESPIPHAHIVTSTTHKTLRGPRGGLILCSRDFEQVALSPESKASEKQSWIIDKGCPLVQGGPLPHVVAAKAICFHEALQPDFRTYAQNVVTNARALAEALCSRNIRVVTGGTDNHLVLVDVRPLKLTGLQAENALRQVGITLNRNMIPGDPEAPTITSGLRLGCAAATTLGMTPGVMKQIGDLIADVLENTRPGEKKSQHVIDAAFATRASHRVAEILSEYQVYREHSELDIRNLAAAAEMQAGS